MQRGDISKMRPGGTTKEEYYRWGREGASAATPYLSVEGVGRQQETLRWNSHCK